MTAFLGRVVGDKVELLAPVVLEFDLNDPEFTANRYEYGCKRCGAKVGNAALFIEHMRVKHNVSVGIGRLLSVMKNEMKIRQQPTSLESRP